MKKRTNKLDLEVAALGNKVLDEFMEKEGLPLPSGDFFKFWEQRMPEIALQSKCEKDGIKLVKDFVLKTGLPKTPKSLKDMPDTKRIDYLDDKHIIFPDEGLGVIGGETGSLKSKGSLSYLLSTDKLGGYYSDENLEGDMKKLCRAVEKDNIRFLQYKKMGIKQIIENIYADCIRTDFKWIFLDPIRRLVLDANSEQVVADALEDLQDLAHELGIFILLTRDYNKVQGLEGLDRFKGSSCWYQVPRQVYQCIPYQVGNTHRKTEDDPICSLLVRTKGNRLPKPKKYIKLTYAEKDIDTTHGKQPGGYALYEAITATDKPKKLTTADAPIDHEKEQTKLFQIYSFILKEDNRDRPVGDIKADLVGITGLSIRQIERLISNHNILKTKKLEGSKRAYNLDSGNRKKLDSYLSE